MSSVTERMSSVTFWAESYVIRHEIGLCWGWNGVLEVWNGVFSGSGVENARGVTDDMRNCGHPREQMIWPLFRVTTKPGCASSISWHDFLTV